MDNRCSYVGDGGPDKVLTHCSTAPDRSPLKHHDLA